MASGVGAELHGLLPARPSLKDVFVRLVDDTAGAIYHVRYVGS